MTVIHRYPERGVRRNLFRTACMCTAGAGALMTGDATQIMRFCFTMQHYKLQQSEKFGPGFLEIVKK